MFSRLTLPSSYYLDESDPDVVILRRQDGAAFVAAFSTRASKEGIVEAAREDYGTLLAQTPRR
jgi:hypothetical protein